MIKKYLNLIIGRKRILEIKSYVKYLKSLPYSSKRKERIVIESLVDTIAYISFPRKHVFCGYFDISPDSPHDKNKILIHKLDKFARAGKDSVKICVADINTGEINEITSSYAWCWQMGARIRWSKEANTIYYNDYSNKGYCCYKYDIVENRIIKAIPHALYDISMDEKIGLTLNFSRLQRLRPGYGYANVSDKSIGKIAPEDDGLYLVNLENGKIELLISFAELNKKMPEYQKGENYINHISIAPDGQRAMFFYIWKTDAAPGWKATLWTIDLKSKKVKCLEGKDQVSHYTWRDNQTLLITGVKNINKEGFYRLYDVITGDYKSIENDNLKQDGHPTFNREEGCFYSDTYPDKMHRQICFIYEKGEYKKLISLYHDPRMYGEKRCDLHPHYFRGDEKIALDTTYDKNKRSVIVLGKKMI